MNYLKILIIDDDTEILHTINNILTNNFQNSEVLSATNASFALEILKEEKVDLIISDWSMPQMTGIEMINILQQNSETALIPVIICTGLMLKKEHFAEALNKGAIDYIKKPVDEVELIARINSIIRYKELYNQYLIEFDNKKELEKKLLEEKVEKADKEISTRVLMLSKYNELLKNTAEKLRKLPTCTNGNLCKPHIADIVSDITTNIFNENWENMIISFEKLYPSFFTDLMSKHSDLTKNETRLCALLKLGLSTKEISAITMQSQRAVEMARYRLRTKLNLNSDENFVNYL